MGKYIDLTGQVYGRLTLLNPTDQRCADGSVKWLCRCECGNYTIASANNIRRGITRSCGCYKKERICEKNRKYNTYIQNGDVCIGVTSGGTKFMVDMEDADRVKQYYWYENDQGYIISHIDGKYVRLHRFILCSKKGEIVDHKNRDKTDNRKSNLRIATRQLNAVNRPAGRNSTTGIKGVIKSANGEKFVAKICKDGKTMHLGTFETIEEAYRERYKKEKELFGEFAYKEVMP